MLVKISHDFMLHALDASGYLRIHNCWTSPVNLIHLPPEGEEYKIIAKKFKDGWEYPNKRLSTIKRIFHVFTDYSNLVGNTQMLFHGTKRTCRIAENATDITTCLKTDCNLCGILKGSYNMETAKTRRMFGPGIYSTSVSSKADDYTSNASDFTKTRVMIVNHVAASHDMQHAPPLYNSVTATTFPKGGKLNYHEAVVYHDDAICANAIIVYE